MQASRLLFQPSSSVSDTRSILKFISQASDSAEARDDGLCGERSIQLLRSGLILQIA